MKAVVIAGTHSGSGKTTVSMAVMSCLVKSGRKVAPFKIGPDYIDPKFHRFITGNPSCNLDSWMLDENTLRFLLRKNCESKDIAVIEGVMGLYDGLDSGISCSTADVAKIIGAPVILVLDAKGMSASAAAMVKGYKDYDKNVNIAGVVFNRVSGEGHYGLLKKAVEMDTNVRCLGYLARDEEFKLESRHLGLIPVEELENMRVKTEAISLSAFRTIDIEGIERASSVTSQYANIKQVVVFPGNAGKGLRIAVAMDEAFNFYYEDNLTLMKESGVELVGFSPLNDKKLPTNIDGLYVGGGFPEVFAEKLSVNESLLFEIKERAENGLPVYAECGGLMYLCSGIESVSGFFYPAVNFFNCRTKMTKRLQRFGYVETEYKGIRTRAHEFHHTTLEETGEKNFEYTYMVRKANGSQEWRCGLARKNVLAGYPHIHFYSNLDFFMEILSHFKKGKH